jgi:hypothetical protein
VTVQLIAEFEVALEVERLMRTHGVSTFSRLHDLCDANAELLRLAGDRGVDLLYHGAERLPNYDLANQIIAVAEILRRRGADLDDPEH